MTISACTGIQCRAFTIAFGDRQCFLLNVCCEHETHVKCGSSDECDVQHCEQTDLGKKATHEVSTKGSVSLTDGYRHIVLIADKKS